MRGVEPEKFTLLRGVVGSTVYGLAREGSDIDHLGVFAYATDAFWGLDNPAGTIVTTAPDSTLHEIGKYVHLALKCNPTILELLWLPEHWLEVQSTYGKQLRSIRDSFLSTKAVRGAYGGYALEQVSRLQRRHEEGKVGFSADTQKRTAKHARHCFRLLTQGRQLLETGSMVLRLPDPERYWAFDNASVEEIVERFHEEDALFKAASSVLPDAPDYATVELFLHVLRRSYL